MPQINLNETIKISKDLFSRLISRGLLDPSGIPTEDFYLYIQECLARDAGITLCTTQVTVDSIPIQQNLKSKESESSLDKPIESQEDIAETTEVEKTTSKNQMNSTDITSRINSLYRRN